MQTSRSWTRTLGLGRLLLSVLAPGTLLACGGGGANGDHALPSTSGSGGDSAADGMSSSSNSGGSASDSSADSADASGGTDGSGGSAADAAGGSPGDGGSGSGAAGSGAVGGGGSSDADSSSGGNGADNSSAGGAGGNRAGGSGGSGSGGSDAAGVGGNRAGGAGGSGSGGGATGGAGGSAASGSGGGGGGNGADVSVQICPGSASLLVDESIALSVTVAGAGDPSVTFEATCGDVDESGVFLAPSGEGTCTVTATSVADPSATATATFSVNPPVGFAVSGTVSHAGSSPVYVTIGDYPWGSETYLVDGPGDYKLRGLDAGSAGTIRVEAFMDVLGTGVYVSGIDPYGYVDVGTTGLDLSSVDITLEDPTPPSIVDPSNIEVLTDDGILSVLFDDPRDADGNSIWEFVRVYAKRDGSPTALDYERLVDVPAGVPGVAIFYGLDEADSWYFLATTRSQVLGVESSGVASGPYQALGSGLAHRVSGNVDTAGATAHSPLFVFCLGNGTGRFTLIDPAATVEPYTIDTLDDGFYQCGAWIDSNGSGSIDPLDPDSFDSNDGVPVVVSGSDVTGVDVVLPDGPAVFTAKSERWLPFGGTETTSVKLEVAPNRRFPAAATFDASSDGLRGPIDFYKGTRDPGQFTAALAYDSEPELGTEYRAHVLYGDGRVCDVSASLSGLLDFPQNPAPASIATSDPKPTFSWEEPSKLPDAYYYQVRVRQVGSTDGDLWSIKLGPGVTSVDFDSDLQASVPELANGSYEWQLEIFDENGNGATVSAMFDVSG